MTDFDDMLRERFRAAVARRDEIMARSSGAREAYEAKRNDILRVEREELAPLKKELLESQSGLYEVQNEIAAIARALKGATGD